MAYITKVTPALAELAQQHPEWEKLTPPRDAQLHAAFRDRAKHRLITLAQLGMAAQKADKADGEERTDIAIIKRAVELLKPLTEQLSAARQRNTVAEGKFHHCGNRLRELEDHTTQLENDLSS